MSRTIHVFVLLASLSGWLHAATVPDNFFDSVLADNLPNGTAMEFSPDGRLFVCQQNGALRVIKNGVLLPTPFLSVVVDNLGERGLLGVAFDPLFLSNGFVYVYHTIALPQVHARISRFQADPANPDLALSGSEKVIVDLDTLTTVGHIGGAIHFGLDGKLYVAVGDNDLPGNAPLLTTTKGKMLRLNADGSIPSDNPLLTTTVGQNQAIWANGLRNPFTFSIHRDNGRILINDVGASAQEEINDGIAGSNYGWPSTEGATKDPRFRGPLLAYPHGSGDTAGCAITGGAWYDGATKTFPEALHNKYFYADYCSGWIRVLDPDTATSSAFAKGNLNTIDLKTGPDGALYYYDRGAARVGRIQHNPAGQGPVISAQPRDQALNAGQPALFQVTATGAQPMTFQWRRDGQPVFGAEISSYTIPLVASADYGARFSCAVTNAFGTSISASATIKTAGINKPPRATITAPKRIAYTAGTKIQFSGSATDTEDGILDASAFTWKVDFHHDQHTHPLLDATSNIKSGEFEIPVDNEVSTKVFYRVTLTVRDSGGAVSTVFSDIKPKLIKLSVLTVPAGAKLTLDGQPADKGIKTTSVAGIRRTVGIVSPQTINGQTYEFDSWSDSGAAEHSMEPTANTTLTVKLKPVGQ